MIFGLPETLTLSEPVMSTLEYELLKPSCRDWAVYCIKRNTIVNHPVINLSGNAESTQMFQSSAETFRDMAAVTPYLAATDKIIIQSRLGRPPTINEYVDGIHKSNFPSL